MKTLHHFSNDQAAYLLYQGRLESLRVKATWESLIKEKDTQIHEMIQKHLAQYLV